MVTVEDLGLLADKADNLAAAANLPMTPQFHVERLIAGIRQMSATLKLYVIEQTGENPWAD